MVERAEAGEVVEVVAAAPGGGPEVMDLESGAAVTARVAAVSVALFDHALGLLRQDRFGAADQGLLTLDGDDGFDAGLGAEAFDHRVG